MMFEYGINTGGPVVIIWGWIIASFFTILVGASMAEICSSYPSAGSVYHWAGILAPIEYSHVSAYICGWFNFLGNAAGDASFAFGFAQVIGAAVAVGTDNTIVITETEYVPIAIGISLFWALKNLFRVDHQGWVNNISAAY